MSNLIPTEAEQRMIHLLFAQGHLTKVQRFAANGIDDRQMLTAWRVFREYLESPLGESLREEIMAAVRRRPSTPPRL